MSLNLQFRKGKGRRPTLPTSMFNQKQTGNVGPAVTTQAESRQWGWPLKAGRGHLSLFWDPGVRALARLWFKGQALLVHILLQVFSYRTTSAR